jgi:uroporphyrinogen-III decarboxylase
MKTWGKAGRGFIGGISTRVLTFGTPDEVRAHTREVIEKGSRYPGFIISSCGQLPGNIPMENMLAYFETRNEMGITAQL